MIIKHYIIIFSIILSIASPLWAIESAVKKDTVDSIATEKKSETALNEEAVPLNLEVPKSKAIETSFIQRSLFAFSIVGILALLSYLAIKKYGKPGSKNSQQQIKILTQHFLGPKKSLAIIRVAGESILIGVTENNINLIKSLALLDEDIPEQTPEKFSNLVEDEDFYFKGIKDSVSIKMKNMKGLQ
ncbi:MAG: FliO/MopB family protein [Pseudobdellovibrionaceae bacterium]